MAMQRQSDGEGGPCSFYAFQRYSAAMFLDDVIADGQTKPGSFPRFLGGKERFEDPVANFLRNTAAGIGNGNVDRIVVLPGSDCYFSLLFNGVGRIDEQVHEDLAQLLWV